MFLLYQYDIFWAFLIISSAIPILAFLICGVLAPIRKGPEKLTSYESLFVVFDVETIFLYPWAISFDVLGVPVFIEALIFMFILIVGSVYVW
ncbi:hypothetical protein DITRI_Ditri11bG0005400 [Diplodiscus trichospermus]